jgi:hypothetical protein
MIKGQDRKKAVTLVMVLGILLLLSAGCIQPKKIINADGTAPPVTDMPELCGNSLADNGENCSNCPQDVKCAENENCENGVCVKKEIPPTEVEKCREEENEIKAELCIKQLAEKNKDAELCSLLKLTGSDTCFRNVASSLKDTSLCGRIKDANSADGCLMAIAAAENDSEACGKVKAVYDREACYRVVALATEDSSICDSIAYARTKDFCIKDVVMKKKDPELCSRIPSTFIGTYLSDDCYMSLGKDISYCFRLREKHRQRECINRSTESSLVKGECSSFEEEFLVDCLYREAMLKGDYTYCLEFADSNRSASRKCLLELADSDYVTADLCPHISDLSERNSCYNSVATSLQDTELCMGISVTELRRSCVTGIALELKDEGACIPLAKDRAGNDTCYKAVALEKLEPALCSMTSYRTSYGECHAAIAYELASPDLCSTLGRGPFTTNQQAINYCYFYYAEYSGENSYCENIKELLLKEKCEDDS